MKEVAIVVGSQFAARGIQEAEAYIDRPLYQNVKLSTVINIAGGLGLALAGSMVKQVPEGLKLPLVVIGGKLLADEVVTLAKQMATPATSVAVRVVSAPMSYPSGESLVRVDR